MGSVQGPIFRSFYKSHLENKIFHTIRKPPIYLRYINDILSLANDNNEINIQDTFQKNSVINFNHELNKNNKISFLDVLININNNIDNITVSTCKKQRKITTPVSSTFKMNVPSDIKKKAVINNIISRAKLISSIKIIFYEEIKKIIK